MAKRITGCGWAYEVVQGLDEAIHRQIKGPKSRLNNRETTLERRSGKSGFAESPQARPTDSRFEHLSPRAFDLYQRYKAKDPGSLLAYANEGNHTPRPKIIVVDMAWDIVNDRIMPKGAAFLTKECESINTERCKSWPSQHDKSETNPLLIERKTKLYDPAQGKLVARKGMRRLDHGAACVGALRISDRTPKQREMILNRGYRRQLNEDSSKDAILEANLWNLSPRADIILVPARRHTWISHEHYVEALKTAAQTGFITREEQAAFADKSSYNLIMDAVANDQTKTCAKLVEISLDLFSEAIKRLKPDSNSSKERSEKNYKCETLFDLISKEHLAKSDRVNPKGVAWIALDSIRKLIACLNKTFEEAGLSETLKLIEKAAKGKTAKVGRGDTVVIPKQVDFWNNAVSGSIEDPLHHPDCHLKAVDFMLDRPADSFSRHSEGNDDYPSKQTAPFDDIKCIELPVIVYRRVEKMVERLTCKHRIAVIISGGNSHIDLGQVCIEKIDKYLPTKRFAKLPKNEERRRYYINRQHRRLFETRGTFCGAIIAGSGIVSLAEYWLDPLSQRFTYKNGSRRSRVANHGHWLEESILDRNNNITNRHLFPNYGLPVNVFGRGSATEIFHAKGKVVKECSYHHWFGASIASMVAAACLANVQQIRLAKDYLNQIEFAKNNIRKKRKTLFPLKPFEARAHFQQWRSNDSYRYDCLEDLMGAPPDIKAWFEGSCYFDVLVTHQLRGARRLDRQAEAEPG